MQNCQNSSLQNTKVLSTNEYPSFKMTRAQLAYTLKSMSKSIKRLHDQEISHRDFKPENIFITFENYLKLGDFGNAKEGSDECESIVFSDNVFSSPQINDERNNRNTKKDDVWALGICFWVLCLGKRELPNREEIAKSADNFIQNLRVDQEIKVIIKKCLEFEEESRASSDEIYRLCKEYCEIVYSEVQMTMSERMYYEIIGFKFDLKPDNHSDLNFLKKIQETKEKCKICGKPQKNQIKYRKFHRVHLECLHSLLTRNSIAPNCLICNEYNQEKQVENSLKNLRVNFLTYKNCSKPDSSLFSFANEKFHSNCRHFINALTKNFKSNFFVCQETKKHFCTLCKKSEIHYHCAGYRKHLDTYQKKAFLKLTKNKKVYLLKYSLVYWQLNLKINRFRSQQVMKKYESNEDNLSILHIHEFCSLFNENFVALDFWYLKTNSSKIRAFYEYLCDGTLMGEYLYRNSNSLTFEQDEIQIFESFINEVIFFMHENLIYHSNIHSKYIYIVKSEAGRIEKFKLGGMKHAKLFTEFNEEGKIIDLKAGEDCINFIRYLNR
jgi:hypothetical protein